MSESRLKIHFLSSTITAIAKKCLIIFSHCKEDVSQHTEQNAATCSYLHAMLR